MAAVIMARPLRRIGILALILCGASLGSCKGAQALPPDRLDIVDGGPFRGYRAVELRRSGISQFELFAANGTRTVGELRLTAQRFDQVANFLAPFEGRALPIDHPNAMDTEQCGEGERLVTDAGGISIAWHRADAVRIAHVALGCNPTDNADRNRRLRAVLDYLGVPASLSGDRPNDHRR